MWMLPLYLNVNQKSDYDNIMMRLQMKSFHNFITLELFGIFMQISTPKTQESCAIILKMH